VKMLDSRPESVKVEKGAEEVAADDICPLCWKPTASMDGLLKHMKLSHAHDLFKCKNCKTLGWSMEILLKHITEVHDSTITLVDALQSFVVVPENIQRINCKMCPAPYQLGAGSFWLGVDLGACIGEIEKHFADVHGIPDQAQVHSKIELACRCCTVTFTPGQKSLWYTHMSQDHTRKEKLEEVGVRCDYCGDNVIEAEKGWHLQNVHARDVFKCQICASADTACFPYADSLKEMMQHMVMKHGNEYDSFYEHMTYPVNLYRSVCADAGCGKAGALIAPTPVRIQAHVTEKHANSEDPPPATLYRCRCCEKDQTFKSVEEYNEHCGKRHKQILKWKATNGNNDL